MQVNVIVIKQNIQSIPLVLLKLYHQDLNILQSQTIKCLEKL